jgi:dihydrofolate reductase
MGVSVDGIVAGGPKGREDPGGEEHPDVKAWKLESLQQIGTHVMGRVTYEEMAAHWPTSRDPYAPFMNDIPKVVFSKTLRSADWPESRIADGDLAEGINNLKREAGKDVMAHGGASFVQALSRLGLVDEYRLVISPVALGIGEPLFKDLDAPLRLKLIETKAYPTGTVIQVYRPA